MHSAVSSLRSHTWAVKLKRHLDLVLVRNLIQVSLSLFLLYEGWQFYRFVRHFETWGATPFVPRPAAVDAFLPVSALVSLKAWIGTGVFDRIHPAALVVLLAVIITSWVFPKAFCSWFCPIGTLSEGLWRLGKRLFGRNWQLPKFLDVPLRLVKYLFLFSFLSSAFFLMPVSGAVFFQASDYNKIADVKMLQFYLHLGEETLVVLLLLMAGSLFIRNFWCRYLCPYGALLGLFGMTSPLTIHRDADLCSGCQRCTRACPNRIDLARAESSISPECTSCYNCLAACPRPGALTVGPLWGQRRLSPRVVVTSLLVLFFGIILVAQLTGHWQSSLLYTDYQRLIPQAPHLGHF